MKASNSARGLDLDDPGLFCLSYVTKSELARILNIARSTLVSWDSIALYRIDSYRQAYPVKADGSTIALARYPHIKAGCFLALEE